MTGTGVQRQCTSTGSEAKNRVRRRWVVRKAKWKRGTGVLSMGHACGWTFWTETTLQLLLCPSPGAFTFTESCAHVPSNPHPLPVSQGAPQQKAFYMWTAPLMSKHPGKANTGPVINPPNCSSYLHFSISCTRRA